MNIYVIKIGDVISDAYIKYDDAILVKIEESKNSKEKISIHCVRLYGLESLSEKELGYDHDSGSHKF